MPPSYRLYNRSLKEHDMKRLTTLFLIGLIFILSSAIAQASPTNVSLANAFFADQMPIGADLYMAIRTDDAYLDELDGILGKIVTQLSETIPNINIPEEGFGVHQLINQVLASSRLDIDFETDIRPWLGSSMAFGLYWGEDVVQDFFIAIDHSNRELVEAFIINTSRRQTEVTVEDNFSIYAMGDGMTLIGINDDAIYIAMRPELLPIDGAPSDTLSNDPNFQKAVGALPSANYNILVAGDTSILAQMMDNNRISTRQSIEALLPDAYTALGATIVNGVSPTIDFAQVGLPPEIMNLINTPVDPSFTQYIPANATGVIHGTNLLAPYNALIDLISAQTGQDMRAQLDQAYTLFGIDVVDLLLSGDFAMYVTYKSEGLESLINRQLEIINTEGSTAPVDITSLLDFGYIFEIPDSRQAQSFIDQVYNLYNMMGANAGVTVSQEEIAGNMALVIRAESVGMESLELIMGTNSSVMVIGTRESATAILTGNGRFDSNPFYQNSLRYTLPSMTHYWFIDRNSLSGLLTILSLLGPNISNVFDNIITNLGTSTPTPEELARQEELRRERARLILLSIMDLQTQLQAFSQIFDNATISLSSKEGILFLRAVVTLTE